METRYKNIIRTVMPLFWYLAVSSAVQILLPGADVSMKVALTGIVSIPLLVFWYRQDRGAGQSTGEKPDADGFGGDFSGVFYGAERNQKSLFRKHASRKMIRRKLLPALACFAVGAALSALSAALMSRLGLYDHFPNTAQEAYQASPPLWLLLGPGLLAPVGEELVYRGLVYRRMRMLLCSPAWSAALASSLIFAIGHGNVIQFLYAFPMGLLLCMVSEMPCARPNMKRARGLSGEAGRAAGVVHADERMGNFMARRTAGTGNVLLPVFMHLGANLYSVAAVWCKMTG